MTDSLERIAVEAAEENVQYLTGVVASIERSKDAVDEDDLELARHTLAQARFELRRAIVKLMPTHY